MKTVSAPVYSATSRQTAGLALGGLFTLITTLLYVVGLTGDRPSFLELWLAMTAPLVWLGALYGYDFSTHLPTGYRAWALPIVVIGSYFLYGYVIGVLSRVRPSWSLRYAGFALLSYVLLALAFLAVLIGILLTSDYSDFWEVSE